MIDTRVWDNRAWLFVLPVLFFVLFSSLLPMMTVVNYSFQDSMGQNNFFWNGVGWFQNLLDPTTEVGQRFQGALLRNLVFSAVVLAIEVPLGIGVSLCIPKSGWKVGATLVVIALPSAHSLQRRGRDLAVVQPHGHRAARRRAERGRRSRSTSRRALVRPGSSS